MLATSAVAREKNFGKAWVALCLTLVLHVVDEASTNFLSVYNPTVAALRDRIGWFPMPPFNFGEWLTGLVLVNLALLLLSPFAFRGARWMRLIAYMFAVIMIFNAVGHTLGTIFGRTIEPIRFARPMPGFYTSPLLLAASIYMLVRLRTSAASV
jgi:hypothetical protein